MFSGSTYRRVPTTEGGLPTPSTSENGRTGGSNNLSGTQSIAGAASLWASPALSRLGRARTRWLIVVVAIFIIISIVTLTSGDATVARSYAGRLRPSQWGSSPANPFLSNGPATTNGQWNDQQYDSDGWVKGSGRQNLTFNSPFNRDDYSLTEDECDAFFPGLWKEIDRSVEYFTTRQK